MKNTLILAASLFCFTGTELNAEVMRSESHIANVSVTIDNTSENSHSRERLREQQVEGISVARRGGENNTTEVNASKNVTKRVYRSPDSQVSPQAYGFEIYDSWIYLDSDADNDGYFSEISVNFDADYAYGTAQVYAEIYLSYEGGDWFHLFSSEDFTISGSDSDDFYGVSLNLNYGIPTGKYDLLIDLYEVGYSDIVATVAPEDDSDLFGLLLEDYDHENVTHIDYVASELYGDLDGDGYYTGLTLEYGVDSSDFGRNVYAEVDIINTATQERVIVSTVDFSLSSQTEFIDIDFSTGYLPTYYDFEIRIVDTYSNEVLALASDEFSSLNYLPIESDEYDYQDVTVDVHVSSGGGSLSWGFVLLVASLVVKRRVKLN